MFYNNSTCHTMQVCQALRTSAPGSQRIAFEKLSEVETRQKIDQTFLPGHAGVWVFLTHCQLVYTVPLLTVLIGVRMRILFTMSTLFSTCQAMQACQAPRTLAPGSQRGAFEKPPEVGTYQKANQLPRGLHAGRPSGMDGALSRVHKYGKQWVSPGMLQRFVMKRASDGEWRWQLRQRPGTPEDFETRSGGNLVSKWKWVQHSHDSAVLILEFDLRSEVVGEVGAVGASPIHKTLWETTLSITGGAKTPIGASRPLSAAEIRDERWLLQQDFVKDSCVYLSLYHLARRATTKQWLKTLDWGRANAARIEMLIRLYVAYEDRGIDLCEVRMKSPNSTAASAFTIKKFVPEQSDGTDFDILLVHKSGPSGGDSVSGHCVPIAGNDYGRQFGWHPDLAFVGLPPEWTAVVIDRMTKKERGRAIRMDTPEPLEADISVAPLQRKEKERVVPVDQMTMAALDEILSVSRPTDRAESSHVVLDEQLALSIQPALAELPADKKPGVKKPPAVETKAESSEAGTMTSSSADVSSGCDGALAVLDLASSSKYGFLCGPCIFEGPCSAPKFPVHWRAGYWSDQGREFGCGDWVDRVLIAPNLCTSTIDMVREWGTRCLYVEPREEAGIKFIRAGLLTDGVRSAEFFKEGSLLSIRGLTYEARASLWRHHGEVYKFLELVRVSSGTVRSCFGVWRFTGNAKLLSFDPRVRGLDYKELTACKWQAEAKTQKNILATGFVNIVRSEQISRKHPLDPDRVVPALRVLATSYEQPRDVSGPFRWGNCFSGCGADRPGKFKGRMCPECSHLNTELGSWAAAGIEICSALNPIRYPGVVHLRKKHPALKLKAKTVADYGTDVGVYDRDGNLVPLDDVMRFSLKSGPGARLGGIGIDGYRPFATSAGPRPLLEAILYRVFKDLGKRCVDKNAFLNAGNLVDVLLPKMTSAEIDPEPDDFQRMLTWAQGMKNPRRRKALLKELFDLRDNGFAVPKGWDKIKPFVKTEHLPELVVVNDWVRGREARGGVDYRALERVADDSFSKTESVDSTGSSLDLDDGPRRLLEADEPLQLDPIVRYVARLIQAPSDYSHLVAGPILKPMIGLLKDDWCSSNWIFYASVAPEKLDLWLDRVKESRSWFWSDYSAFDSTYSPEAWDLLEGIYARICPHAPDMFWKVLEKWRTPQGDVPIRSSGPLNWRLKYQARTCNCSGRDDTALANALLNGIVLSISFAAALAGVDVTQVQAEHVQRASELINIAIVGDDSLVACEFDISLYRAQVEANIKRFGLIAEVNSSDHLYDVTFLGQMPYPVGGRQYQWGPTIGRRLYKAFWQLEDSGGLPSWTRGVAQQLSLFRNVPILRHLAERVDWLLTGHAVTKQTVDPNRVWAARTSATLNYSEDVFDWLCLRYQAVGLSIQMIKDDIKRISEINRLPAMVRLESVSRILALDDL